MIKPDFMEASAFVAIVEYGGFSKAAGRLGISTPRVSELLRNFEERLGVRLVDRTTRSVNPTVAGEALLTRLAPLLDEFRVALETTSELGGTISGQLRLTVAPQASNALMAPHLLPFLKSYPDVDLEISLNGELIDIVEDRFDAGIHFGNFIEKDMIAKKIIGDIPIVVAASPAYIAKFGEPNHPNELADHSCFGLRLPNGAVLPWHFKGENGTLKFPAKGRLIANSVPTQIEAALQGIGLIQCTKTMVENELASGTLVTVLDKWARPPLAGIFLYYPSRRQMRPALKALIDFLGQRRDGQHHV